MSLNGAILSVLFCPEPRNRVVCEKLIARYQESHCVLKDECDCIILEFVNTVAPLSFEYFIAKVVSLKRCSYLNFKSFTDEEVGGVAEAML